MNYKKCNPDPTYKASAKGACQAHIYECKTFITNALQLNQSICKSMSLLQKTSCCFNSVNVSLEKQVNMCRLHPADYVAQYTTILHHPKWFKQLSHQWQNLRSNSHITAALHSMPWASEDLHKENHFREYIYKKNPAPVDPLTQ